MKKDIFIGGAWPYANYYLHIGHLAALLPGEVIARYYRQNGDNVIYVSGSDCHGTPITQRAKKENKKPETIANYYHREFVKTFNKLDFQYDKYSSTNSIQHKNLVKEFFLKLYENGFIYEKNDAQDYCPSCKAFLSDREIVGFCPHCSGQSTGDQCEECSASLNSSEVINKHCKECGSKTSTKSNKHLYFRLTSFEKNLQNLINSRSKKWRKNALGETQKYLDMGLIDRAATRQLDWGVDVPLKGYDDKKIYVWIEAVLGYLTSSYDVAKKKGINFNRFFDNNNENLITYYVHGKDNIPFHTIIFPAILYGLSQNYSYRLPDYILSSAYVNLNSNKMSKSKGNLITVNELLETFDKDTIRFYFILKNPEHKDISCSISEIVQCHNKFLVGSLGNFINRNLSFVLKKFSGRITKGSIDDKIKKITINKFDAISDLIINGELKAALYEVLDYISLGNKYYDEQKPWIQVNNNINDFNNTTYTCIYIINNISNLIYPFIPSTAIKIKNILNLPAAVWKETTIDGDFIINEAPLLFERIKV